MTLWQRIESLDELDAYLRDLFGPDIQPSGTNGYQVMFTVAGKAKPVMSALQEKNRQGRLGRRVQILVLPQ